jgi:hypothetical protein
MNEIVFFSMLISITLFCIFVLILVGYSKVKKVSYKFYNSSLGSEREDLRERVRRKVKSIKSKLKHENAQLSEEYRSMAKTRFGDKVQLVNEANELE